MHKEWIAAADGTMNHASLAICPVSTSDSQKIQYKIQHKHSHKVELQVSAICPFLHLIFKYSRVEYKCCLCTKNTVGREKKKTEIFKM